MQVFRHARSFCRCLKFLAEVETKVNATSKTGVGSVVVGDDESGGERGAASVGKWKVGKPVALCAGKGKFAPPSGVACKWCTSYAGCEEGGGRQPR